MKKTSQAILRGRPGAFFLGPDRITTLSVEKGEFVTTYALPTPYIVHYTREAAANLSGTRLEEADLRKADLSYAFMPGADLSEATLDAPRYGISSCLVQDLTEQVL
jgi:uncharacterized protein YjbI with pentapeptide repeats